MNSLDQDEKRSTRLQANPSRNLLGRICLSFFAAILALVCGEVALRLFYEPKPVYCGWRSFSNARKINEMGFRGQNIQYSRNDIVVLLVGDSQVEAAACSYEEMPERRLEHYLSECLPSRDIRVFTLGASGYGQDQQLLVLQDYFKKHRADYVILWQTMANDIWNNLFPTHWPANGYPKPTYRLKDGKLLGPNFPMGANLSNLTSSRFLNLFLRFVISPRRMDEGWEAHLPPAYRPVENYDGPIDMSWQQRLDSGEEMIRQENLESEKSHMAIYLEPRSPRMQYGLDLTRALLSEIKKTVEDQDGRFFLFNVERPDVPPLSKFEVHRLKGKLYRTSEKQFRENRQYLNEPFDEIRIRITLEDNRVSPTDNHLNPQAVDEAMQILAAKIANKINPQ